MKPKKLLFIVTALLAICLLAWLRLSPQAPVFPELTGPAHDSIVAASAPTTMSDFPVNGKQSLAIWVNDPNSSWLGVALGLKSIGLPFNLVTDIDAALQHNVVMVYPSLTGGNTTPESQERLHRHVQQGGTLIGFSVLSGGMRSLFGFSSSNEHAKRQHLKFTSDSLSAELFHSGPEKIIRLNDPSEINGGLPGTHYLGFESALALFEDGSAAITHKPHPTSPGHAYAFGFDIGHFILRAYNGRFAKLADTYVNGFQPQVDTMLSLISLIYQQGEPNAVVLSPTPHGKRFTALLTHDVDFTKSIKNIPEYAALEKSYGIPATYFIQTKYVTDYNDQRFFDPSVAPILTSLLENGMEIASHSVAHSNEFARMPTGTGQERYPEYTPYVKSFDVVENATRLGELRVSKFLLEAISDANVVSFRPGHLSSPESLPQLLVASGYRFSSSITANEAMTHLPYRLMYDRTYTSQVDAFEFPVTIEDEEGNLLERFDEIVHVSNQIAQYQGLVNLMVHTDTLGDKLRFVQRYIEHFKDEALFETVSGFGNWWSVRDSAVINTRKLSSGIKELEITVDGSIDGLTLQIPTGWQYQSGLDGTLQSQRDQVIMGPFTNRATLLFQ
jgi:peptidoglycan/xylan/chitin deacetylase (PgdA/CDA1 family)